MTDQAPPPGSLPALMKRWGANYRWYVTITAMMGTISTVLSSTIVNVALPDIMGTFGMGQDKAQLISTGFLAAMTGTMLINAWLVDSFGQRATFSGTIAVFIAASAMGGLAPSEPVLILARVLQGGAAGVLQPLAMVTIFQVFPPERRGSAMGIYGIGVVLAPALGPTIGGLMVDSFNWRFVFFLVLPSCVAGLFLSALFMPGRATSGPRKPFDWIGFALLSVFLVVLLNGLSNGQRHGWRSHMVLADFTLAAISGLAFVAWESWTAAPMLNLALFRSPSFSGASVVAIVFGAGIFGSTYLVPIFVQTIQGYTATRSGLVLMPAGLILTIAFPIAGRLTDKLPADVMITAGLLLFAWSSLLMAGLDTNTPFWSLAIWIALGRIGLSLIMPSLNAGALRALPPQLLGQGSGALNFVRQLGGAIGTNLLAVMSERRGQLYAHAFATSQDTANPATVDMLRQLLSYLLAEGGIAEGGIAPGFGAESIGLAEGQRLGYALDYLGRMLAAQAAMMGYRDGFLLVAIAFVIAIPPAWLMRLRPRRGG